MVLESTFICVDNSDWMVNGDFLPTRLAAQQDAVNLVTQTKLRSNPESNVGLLSLSDLQVLVTLTTDSGKVLAKLHSVAAQGQIKFIQGIKIAHLALKHRQSKHHKTRIVAFVGSPLAADEATLVKVAKKLKKEKVNVDVISFGEADENAEVLRKFVETVNGKDGTGSHLVTIPPGPHLSDALISSPILQSEDGSGPNIVTSGGGGFDFGVDPNEDPELAMALRISMEEQRARQQAEGGAPDAAAAPAAAAAGAGGGGGGEGGATSSAAAASSGAQAGGTQGATSGSAAETPDSDEALLQRALAMSMEQEGSSDSGAGVGGGKGGGAGSSQGSGGSSSAGGGGGGGGGGGPPDLSAMTEEEQIAYAMRMSMQDTGSGDSASGSAAEAMDVDEPVAAAAGKADEGNDEEEEDYTEAMNDPAYLQSVLESLPGVDPQSEEVKTAMGSLTGQKKEEDKKKDEKKKSGGGAGGSSSDKKDKK